MSKELSDYRGALAIVGVICLVATAIHGIWIVYMPGYAALASLDEVQMNTIKLLNAAITLFLLHMGVFTLLVSRSGTLSHQHVRTYAVLLGSFWMGRFLLEIFMPLKIPLLFIERPGLFAKSFMLAPVLILLIPAARAYWRHSTP